MLPRPRRFRIADSRDFAAIRQSRLLFFSPEEVLAMFGVEDTYDRYKVERYEIAQNKALTGAQKQENLSALDAATPPELRTEQEAPLAVAKLEKSVQQACCTAGKLLQCRGCQPGMPCTRNVDSDAVAAVSTCFGFVGTGRQGRWKFSRPIQVWST